MEILVSFVSRNSILVFFFLPVIAEFIIEFLIIDPLSRRKQLEGI